MPRVLVLFLMLGASFSAAAQSLPPGPFTEAECVGCHDDETPEIAAAWRGGPHGSMITPVGCSSCHGEIHNGAAARARRPIVCIDCHGGEKAPSVRSYATSKHGVIAGLEDHDNDYSQSLSEANYRAPSCAYCHLHDGGHGASANAGEACLDCHSPRFTETYLRSAKRGLDIGKLKLREAEEAVAAWKKRDAPSAAKGAELDALLRAMRDGPMKGLRLGNGHQSPDYQWWLGQAALDGALVRIKAKLSRLGRVKALKKN